MKEERHINEKKIEEKKILSKYKEEQEIRIFMKAMENKGMHKRLEDLKETELNCLSKIFKQF